MSFIKHKNRWGVAAVFMLTLMLMLLVPAQARADIVGNVTTDNVNIRSGPGAAHSVIGKAGKNDSFVVVNREGDWYAVRYPGNARAYINVSYLKVSQEAGLPSLVRAGSGSVNVRGGPGTDRALLGSFGGGTALAVTGESGYWYAVAYNGKTGYVAKWLVNADYSDTTPPAQDNIYATALVNAETLNLRDAPEGDILAKLISGTRLYVLESRDGWYKVESPEGQGWVHGGYIRFDQAQSSACALPRAAIPAFGGSEPQGRVSLDWQEENFGYQLTLNGDSMIRYEIIESARGLSIITDMALSGGLPENGSAGLRFDIEGEFGNIITFSGSDLLHYNISGEDYDGSLRLTVGLSPLIGRLIYIDPGHASVNNETGKIDPGAMKGDLVEKDITYEISLHIRRMLTARGADVLLSRGEVTDLSLELRAAPANAANADILVSVHVNAANNINSGGSSTWFFAPEGDDSYDRGACRTLAECIQRYLLAYGGLNDYGIREANFAVLRASEMPAVLVETAFLTNEDDAAKLADPAFRELLADAIVSGIIEYFRIME
ncbi:MAG: N-acetylmuramoyl-L-alanine amidase [Clostridiales bacterium]|nr:N-acetylmuramoyl-L-alanine amidase [Clostridiales bacterium]